MQTTGNQSLELHSDSFSTTRVYQRKKASIAQYENFTSKFDINDNKIPQTYNHILLRAEKISSYAQSLLKEASHVYPMGKEMPEIEAYNIKIESAGILFSPAALANYRAFEFIELGANSFTQITKIAEIIKNYVIK
jgi:hypothetical protein